MAGYQWGTPTGWNTGQFQDWTYDPDSGQFEAAQAGNFQKYGWNQMPNALRSQMKGLAGYQDPDTGYKNWQMGNYVGANTLGKYADWTYDPTTQKYGYADTAGAAQAKGWGELSDEDKYMMKRNYGLSQALAQPYGSEAEDTSWRYSPQGYSGYGGQQQGYGNNYSLYQQPSYSQYGAPSPYRQRNPGSQLSGGYNGYYPMSSWGQANQSYGW